jgi:hypothetical protein
MSVVHFFGDSLKIDETILDRWSAQNPNLVPPAYGHARTRRSALSAGEPVLSLRRRNHGRLTHDCTDVPDVPATGRSVEVCAQAITTPLHLDLPGTLGADTCPCRPSRDGELGSCPSDRR